MPFVRPALIAVAVLACAWFALGVRQATATRDAAALVTGAPRLGAADARHAASLLHDARGLNPDAQVDVLRAELALGQGDPAAARRTLDAVTRREPMNLAAWVWLARSSAGDPANLRRSFAQLRRLLPPVPPPR